MKRNVRKTKFLFLGLLLALASCSNSKAKFINLEKYNILVK